MFASYLAVAEGIATQEDANTMAQLSTAMATIAEAVPIPTLNIAWMDAISEISNLYFSDMLKVSGPDVPPPPPPGNPHDGSGSSMTAVTAMDNAIKSKDQSQSDLETGNMNNLVETNKAIEGFLGNSLSSLFTMWQPLKELLDQANSLTKSV